MLNAINDRKKAIAAGVAGAALVSSATFLIKTEVTSYKEDHKNDCGQDCEVKKFDALGLKLSEGDIIPIGVSSAPGLSQELVFDDQLAKSKLPELGTKDSDDNGNFGPNAKGGGSHDDLANIDSPREIVFTTSNPTGINKIACGVIYINLNGPDDGVMVAMPDTESARVEDFSATVSADSVEVCWSGKERDAKDDPYLVIQRVTIQAEVVG